MRSQPASYLTRSKSYMAATPSPSRKCQRSGLGTDSATGQRPLPALYLASTGTRAADAPSLQGIRLTRKRQVSRWTSSGAALVRPVSGEERLEGDAALEGEGRWERRLKGELSTRPWRRCWVGTKWRPFRWVVCEAWRGRRRR
ncbi:hypothetical protein ZWY2020_052369 [Hordeum vulgare]|nr:hypothetical protein ZWY2020_052367 [Hordeum vulgare]KAI4997027.1 hypothetical protein ZWY2020_052369 [Hordeum vulgare]